MTTLGKTLMIGHSLIVAGLLVMAAPTPSINYDYPSSDSGIVAEQLDIITAGRDCADAEHSFLTDHVIVETNGLVTEVTFEAALNHGPTTTILAYCK